MKYMRKLLYLLSFALLLPLAALATGDNRQVDKTEKDTRIKSDGTSAKQGKPDAVALDPVPFEFMRSNLISTFYHELAHALIDTMDLPVLGREEAAADVFSVLMVERLFDEAAAIAINKGAALGYEVDAIKMREKGREWDWADEHGADMQRYYNIVCLTYGAAPKRRDDFATEMLLPEDRAETCENEFAQAKRSWAPFIAQISEAKTGATMQFRDTGRTALHGRAAEILAAEVTRVNEVFSLPKPLRVVLKRCKRSGNIYAYYSSSREKITVCSNYIDELYRDAPK